MAMLAFTFFIKEHFNPTAAATPAATWHADIGISKDFTARARVVDFNSLLTPPLKSKFCDLQNFRPALASRFLRPKATLPANDAQPQAPVVPRPKRNIFQPYRFR